MTGKLEPPANMEEVPSTPRKNRVQRSVTTSPYFTDVQRKRKVVVYRHAHSAPSSPEKLPSLLTFESKLPMGPEIDWSKPAAPISDEDVEWYTEQFKLLDNPSYAFSLRKSTYLNFALFCAKPALIQEKLAHDPWKLLLAVTLLNKTAGRSSIPVFWKLIDRWPTPAALAQADAGELRGLLQPLGLQDVRARRMIDMSAMFLADPPRSDCLRRSRAYILRVVEDDQNGLQKVVKVQYPPTQISHLPGVGAYALDSYRIFSTEGEEWKSVMPLDKELIRYLKWKWAFEGCRWEPLKGPVAPLDVDYLEILPSLLSS